MALRLVRETSETPNITNKDDTIMTRYAYGGYNGVVKAYGSECEYIAENGFFKVLDGRIVVDGWEIDVDGAGYNLNLSTVSGIQYHSVYAEVTVATENVKIDSTYLQGAYPEIEKGDDLTNAPNGTARLLLYNVKVENGVITEVIKKFNLVPYLAQKVLDLEKRLEELGFKQGVLSNPLINDYLDTNSLIKQGKYAICNLYVHQWSSDNYTAECGYFVIPDDFRPAEDIEAIGLTATRTDEYEDAFTKIVIKNVTLADGSIQARLIPERKIEVYLPSYLLVQNIGWRIM